MNDLFTHGFGMTFELLASRDAYLPHPVHELAKDVVIPKFVCIVVFDFEV